MYRCLVVSQFVLYVASAMMDYNFINSRISASQYECYDYAAPMPLRSYDTGWNLHKKLTKMFDASTPRYWPSTSPAFNVISRRVDLLWNRDDIVKEHAKLVQDINSLRQVMYVAPLTEEKDYDDSIFPELIETSSTTTSRPTTTRISRPTKSGIPVLLLGGGSRRHTSNIKAPQHPKKTISLVGTTSPLVKHPYPFVMAGSSQHPVRICMASPILYSTATRRPSLWERLFKAIVPSQV